MVTALIGCLVAAGGAASGAVALAAYSGGGRRPAPAQDLDVLPFPGTPDAAPGTNIDLPAASRAQVQSVTAVGARSGLHPGRLSAQPAGNGTAFTPNRPFSPGERVTVTASLRSTNAGTASGAPGKKQISYSFSVARAVSAAAEERRAGVEHSTGSSRPRTHTFVTHPRFKVPVVTMKGKDPDRAAGDIFLDAQNTGQNASYILNASGALIWYRPVPRRLSIRNVRVQSYHGHPVLTFWKGRVTKLGSHGEGLILNRHYRTIHTVTAGKGYQKQGADLHEFVLGHEGSEATAFISIFAPVRANLTSVGGPPNGTVYDRIIQEIDIATGKVIWEWHALGHVPVSSSYVGYVPGRGYDFFHLNSIQQLKDGNILISARSTWAVYLINKKTGRIIWRVGGKHPSFRMGVRTNFQWQHDATLHTNGLLTLFDDASAPPERSQSRALKLHLSTKTHRATLVRQYRHSPPTLAASQGSVQVLPDGNVFVGWGAAPYFSEYTSRGKQLFGGSFRAPVNSYRAYRFKWFGEPLQPPAIAVRRSSTAGRDVVHASWNGATRVASWQVLASPSASGPFVNQGSPARWTNFETRIKTPSARYFEVEALNSQGHILGTSAVAAAN